MHTHIHLYICICITHTHTHTHTSQTSVKEQKPWFRKRIIEYFKSWILKKGKIEMILVQSHKFSFKKS